MNDFEFQVFKDYLGMYYLKIISCGVTAQIPLGCTPDNLENKKQDLISLVEGIKKENAEYRFFYCNL
jgi:hypothetical protein